MGAKFPQRFLWHARGPLDKAEEPAGKCVKIEVK
jgi:hypothetical protein